MSETKLPVIDTFERVEDKYALRREQADEIVRRCREYITEDAFFRYPVYSIYCDSDGADLIIRSLMSTGYKAKLRLRSYGDPSHSPVFLEMKKKLGSIVYKKRIMLSEQEAYDYLEKGIPHSVTGNTADEIGYMIQYYGLKEKVFIAYDRTCWSALRESDVRITFDTNIRYRTENLSLHEDGSEKMLSPAEVMMEIKAMDRYPMWLTKVLSDMGIRRSSFSKYGTVYRTDDAFRKERTAGVKKAPYRRTKEELVCSVQY